MQTHHTQFAHFCSSVAASSPGHTHRESIEAQNITDKLYQETKPAEMWLINNRLSLQETQTPEAVFVFEILVSLSPSLHLALSRTEQGASWLSFVFAWYSSPEF